MDETKKEKLINYLQNLYYQAKTRLSEYIRDEKGKQYPKRYIFPRIEKYCSDFFNKTPSSQRWIIIPGLRGVGKTTLLSQIFYNFLPLRDNGEIEILFISLDEPRGYFDCSLAELLMAYEELRGESFENMKKPLLLIIDEVHVDSKWAQILKSLYDRTRRIFMLCSGSSAVHLQSTPDVARRAITEKLYPMSFIEYELIKNNIPQPDAPRHGIKEVLYSQHPTSQIYEGLQKLKVKVNEYWSKVDRKDITGYMTTGSLPFSLRTTESHIVYGQIKDLIEKIIQKDLREINKFDSSTLDVIKRLLFIIAESENISIKKLSGLLDINYITTTSILDVLEQAELLIRIPAYGSRVSQARKPPKYLFVSPAIRMSLFNIAGQTETLQTRKGKLLEDVVGGHLYREFIASGAGTLTYDSSQGGADFILQIGNKLQIAVEVGIGNKGLKQLTSTMQKVKCNYGIVFSNDPLALHDNILKVPLDYFFLM
ncbi:MAG: ATP-binding protein [Planctomycetes bacterium]|nr:ATP-binding protein [Planctomycetota bacterium]